METIVKINQNTEIKLTKNIPPTNGSLMKNILKSQKSFFQLPKVGDIVEGSVIGKESGVLYIDLNILGTGVVYGTEYFKVQDEIKKLKQGDKLVAKIIDVENDDGYRELSLKKAEEEKNWKYLQEKQASREVIDVKITDANKGGLMARIGDLDGFLPVSQLTPANYPRVEGGDKSRILQELKKFVGITMRVHILDADPKNNKLIFSEKSAESEAINSSLSKYKIDDVVEGEITGVVDFGAFIKFDPILEGLIHISELDWSLVEKPSDVIKIGDKVKAKIVDIAEDGKVSLSLKALKDNPWKDIEKKYKKGDKVDGEVTKLNSYGALVKLDNNIQGLIHISEFTSEEELKAQVKIDTKYKFEILSVDPEEHRISLKLAE